MLFGLNSFKPFTSTYCRAYIRYQGQWCYTDSIHNIMRLFFHCFHFLITFICKSLQLRKNWRIEEILLKTPPSSYVTFLCAVDASRPLVQRDTEPSVSGSHLEKDCWLRMPRFILTLKPNKKDVYSFYHTGLYIKVETIIVFPLEFKEKLNNTRFTNIFVQSHLVRIGIGRF